METFQDPEELAKELAVCFGDTRYRVTTDSHQSRLYIELPSFSDEIKPALSKKIEEILDEADTEYDEIILLKLHS